MKDILYIVDGSSLLYRGYYGVKPLHAPDGTPVQAVYVFCRMMYKLIDEHHPSSLVIAWDSPGKTVRHEWFVNYKVNRQAPPSDLFEQKKLIQEFCTHAGIAQVMRDGVEADDIMFSLAHDWRVRFPAGKVVLVTSDKDMGQMVNDDVIWYEPVKDVWYDVQTLTQKLGYPIAKIPFYFALVGDSSDNIPGVRGIGEKTARDLVLQFDTLDDLYTRIGTIKTGRVAVALAAHKDEAYLSLKLFLLQYVPGLMADGVVFAYASSVNDQLISFFDRLGFASFKKKFEAKAVYKQSVINADTMVNPVYTFDIVTDYDHLVRVVDFIKKAGVVAFDTETDGAHPRIAVLVGISLAIDDTSAWYIPCAHRDGSVQLSMDVIRTVLGSVFNDPAILKIAHNAVFDLMILRTHGIMCAGNLFDTMIAASLLTTQQGQKIGLKDLALHYGNVRMLTYSQVVTDRGYQNFSYVPVSEAVQYAANDALQTIRLYGIFRPLLIEKDCYDWCVAYEFPLIYVLNDMEYEGVAVDVHQLKQLSEQADYCLEVIKKDIEALVLAHQSTMMVSVQQINFNSPKQIEWLLFEYFGLKPVKKNQKTERYSTDNEVLIALAKEHPVPALLIRYRELAKLKNTYLEALPDYIISQTGHIHTHFSQTRVVTGRLSSSDPNMQNIPADPVVGIAVRTAFKAPEGYQFLAVDYSQIELRVLAYLSQDPVLLNAFINGDDIHQETAATIFKVPSSLVSYEQRQIGKKINFSIIYGLTPYGLAKDLDITVHQARDFIDAYFARYEGVRRWMDTVVSWVYDHGYVKTYYGRRRYIPAIYEKNRTLYEEARRIAINTIVQGTQAELLKKGMVMVFNYVKKQYPHVRILLQIHDELVLKVPVSDVAMVKEDISRLLESVEHWNVPLVVKVRCGDNWQDMK